MNKELLEQLKDMSREERAEFFKEKKEELLAEDLEDVNGGMMLADASKGPLAGLAQTLAGDNELAGGLASVNNLASSGLANGLANENNLASSPLAGGLASVNNLASSPLENPNSDEVPYNGNWFTSVGFICNGKVIC